MFLFFIINNTQLIFFLPFVSFSQTSQRDALSALVSSADDHIVCQAAGLLCAFVALANAWLGSQDFEQVKAALASALKTGDLIFFASNFLVSCFANVFHISRMHFKRDNLGNAGSRLLRRGLQGAFSIQAGDLDRNLSRRRVSGAREGQSGDSLGRLH